VAIGLLVGGSRPPHMPNIACLANTRSTTARRYTDPEHEEQLEWVQDLAEASDHTDGSRRMAKSLQDQGYRVGRHQARSLMREAGVWVRYRRRYRVTTNSKHDQPMFENRLERQFAVEAPDQVYADDITYVWTAQGWLYWPWSSTCTRARWSAGRWGGA